MSSSLLIMKNFSKYNKTPTFLFLSPIQNKWSCIYIFVYFLSILIMYLSLIYW